MRPEICLKSAFQNFKYVLPQIISPCSTPSPPLHCSSPSPIIPPATMVIHVRVSEEQGDMKIQWPFRNTTRNNSLTRYRSNMAIYANIHVLVISLY